MFEQRHIGFIGAGNMGEALLKGLLAASLVSREQIHVYDVSSPRMQYLGKTHGIRSSSTIADLAHACEIIVLAVKPQTMASVLDELCSHLSHHPLVISIAAGLPLSMLHSALPEGIPIVRVMPNTPALVLEGASALSRGPNVSDEQMQLAVALFKAVGKTVEVEEKSMDVVTGLSGSGPAYILLVLESLIDAGVLMGLPRPAARELVLQTALGAVKMVQETGKHPAELRDIVTSPGGTTIHGLSVLEDLGVRGALMRAVEAAALRSAELGKS
ncbi:MAG: pyrroline-5-carboxylate reductase [Syntrophobacteraceae bacterium]